MHRQNIDDMNLKGQSDWVWKFLKEPLQKLSYHLQYVTLSVLILILLRIQENT